MLRRGDAASRGRAGSESSGRNFMRAGLGAAEVLPCAAARRGAGLCTGACPRYSPAVREAGERGCESPRWSVPDSDFQRLLSQPLTLKKRGRYPKLSSCGR